MTIEVKCPHCKSVLRVPEKYAGQSGTCNHCQNAITIPHTLSAYQQVQVAQNPAKVEAETKMDNEQNVAQLLRHISILKNHL